MGRVTGKASGVVLPLGTDEFVGGQPAQGLQALGVVMGPQKGLPVLIEFVRGPVVVALHGRLFAGTVHTLDPAVGPGVGRLGSQRTAGSLPT